MNPTLTTQHLSSESAQRVLEDAPDCVKAALMQKAGELDCSIEQVVEMAGSFAVPKATLLS
ncbi:hypothetical protein [Leptolyngbya sp. NIES-2104]|uniref:hypothetical protein n=1 Tax=Leptolyngbya sp. NIES-2104 TaxID=1552121 RepID=UPI0006ECCDD1|nr:hypothetical protein [Leptolyngbya sp. NIES-2104]GAP93616.1 hypothetical protein NIES2104_01230 [Leptolyngbya sp. NIES-2104]